MFRGVFERRLCLRAMSCHAELWANSINRVAEGELLSFGTLSYSDARDSSKHSKQAHNDFWKDKDRWTQ